MADITTFTTVANGDHLYQGYFNTLATLVAKNTIYAAENSGEASNEYPNVAYDLFGSDTASSKINFTHATSEYDNKQTSAASITFNNLLSPTQKSVLAGTETSVLLSVNEYTAGATTTSIITNPSFETGNSGGWTISVGGTCASSIVTSSDGTGVTQGTYCLKFICSNTATSSGQAAQSVDMTNVRRVFIDYYELAGSNSVTCTVSGSIGGLAMTGGDSWADSGSGNVSKTLIFDNRSGVSGNVLTGTQTLLFKLNYSSASSGATNQGARFDNVRFEMKSTTNTTRTYKVSYDGGTNWVTVSNNTLTNLGYAITDLGVRIEETNTSATTYAYGIIYDFGIFYG